MTNCIKFVERMLKNHDVSLNLYVKLTNYFVFNFNTMQIDQKKSQKYQNLSRNLFIKKLFICEIWNFLK